MICKECIAEVRCDATLSYGSGYLLTDELVLTACHVLDDSGGDRPRTTEAEVRLLQDPRTEAGGWRGAELAWPEPGQWRELFDRDIALLKIRNPDQYTQQVARRPPFQRTLQSPDAIRKIVAVGFPKFKEVRMQGEERKTIRDTQQIAGEVQEFSSVKAEKWDVIYMGRQPRNDEDWRGISGAVLFDGDAVVGVISRKVRGEADFQAGMADFKAVRIDAALRDQRFRELVRAEPLVGAKPRRPFGTLPGLVWLVDRDRQEGDFRSAFGGLLKSRPVRPLVCIIVGASKHCPNELLTRFQVQTVPRLGRPDDPAPDFRHLEWPRSVDDPAAEFQVLYRLLWDQLADPGEEAPPAEELGEFARRFSDRTRPHLFESEIRMSSLDAGQARLFGDWLEWLGRLAEAGLDRPPLHAILIKDAGEKEVKTWLASVAVPEKLMLQPLRELSDCAWGDFGEWRIRVRAWDQPLGEAIEDLKDEIEGMLGGQGDFSVKALKDAVRAVSKRQTGG